VIAEQGDIPGKGLIEVYPHTALIELMASKERLKYKVGRASKYWPGTSVPERIDKLVQVWGDIRAALAREAALGKFDAPSAYSTLAAMKPYEDCLDAIICGWVGAKYLRGEAKAYGDKDAAIWVPT
jgi:predicted RNase H-like nuclease